MPWRMEELILKNLDWLLQFPQRLHDSAERFVRNHPGFGIPDLMRYIVIGQGLVYVLSLFSTDAGALQFLAFNWNAILHGQIWRLVTFLIASPSTGGLLGPIGTVILLYLYYSIGTALEQSWGTGKFTLYYLSGAVLTLAVSIISAILTGYSTQVGTQYINLSLFFAYAMLFPETQFLLFLIIPVKVKWLAWFDAAVFAWGVLQSIFVYHDLAGALLPLIALANFFVFFWPAITDELSWRRARIRHQTSHQTIRFRTAARQQRRKEARQGYRHKCDVCGRTDHDFPELEFRYCSRCAGYHCFCQDHIYNHEHFTQ